MVVDCVFARFPIEFAWIFQSIFNGCSMVFDLLCNCFSMDAEFWKGFQWIMEGFPMDAGPVFTAFSMEFGWISMHSQWNLDGFPMKFQWMLDGFSTDFQWTLDGCSIDCQWMSNGFWKHFQFILIGCSMDFGMIFN